MILIALNIPPPDRNDCAIPRLSVVKEDVIFDYADPMVAFALEVAVIILSPKVVPEL